MKRSVVPVALLFAALTGGCTPASTDYLLAGAEGFHPSFAHLSWFDRSVLVVLRVPRESAVDLEVPDKVVLCFSKSDRKLVFSGVSKARPAVECSAYVSAAVVGYGGVGPVHQQNDPLLIQPEIPIDGPWFNRDAQRQDPGVVNDITLWVRLADDGRITKGTVASVSHRPGKAFAPK